jgi:hypothetical protein
MFRGPKNGPLVVTKLIETMELLHVQGPKNNIQADGLFEGKNDISTPLPDLQSDMECSSS